MNTKYDWADVPQEVQWIATDSNRAAFGYMEQPIFNESGRWDGEFLSSDEPTFIYCIPSKQNTFNGCAEYSLEQRPVQGGTQ